MITLEDIDKLKWIAKRLVHKHNEDPAIITFMNSIIAKIESGMMTHENLAKQLKYPAQESIKHITKMIAVLDNIPQELEKNQKSLLAKIHINTFEEMDDIMSILKNS